MPIIIPFVYRPTPRARDVACRTRAPERAAAPASSNPRLDACDGRVADARLSLRDRARAVVVGWRWRRRPCGHLGAVGLQPAPVPGPALQALAPAGRPR